MFKFLIYFLSFTFVLSCKPDSQNNSTKIGEQVDVKASENDGKEEIRWKGTVIKELTNGSASLRLPNSWERSTKANGFAKKGLAVDQSALEVVKLVFNQMTFEPEVLDVFEIPQNEYRVIYMLNTDTISLSRGAASKLTRSIQTGYQELDKDLSDVTVKLEGNDYKDDPDHKVLRFKYSFANSTDPRKSYLNIFFVTTDYRSFIIYEISDTPDDSALYWWSIKAGA